MFNLRTLIRSWLGVGDIGDQCQSGPIAVVPLRIDLAQVSTDIVALRAKLSMVSSQQHVAREHVEAEFKVHVERFRKLEDAHDALEANAIKLFDRVDARFGDIAKRIDRLESDRDYPTRMAQHCALELRVEMLEHRTGTQDDDCFDVRLAETASRLTRLEQDRDVPMLTARHYGLSLRVDALERRTGTQDDIPTT